MLGDTAVAVNPKDKRYRKYINRFVLLPLMNRKIPIVEDDFVDMEFGTGAVKITPAHDPNDFDIGRRHNLEEINIMDDCAVLNSNAGKYKGMDRYRAREKVVKDLKKQGYLILISDHISSVGHCSRCETVVEPRISMQWFVSMSKLVKPAINAVKEGKVKIIPKKWEKIYFNWMENIKDWCISRQLWWGHRIPVWYCKDCGEMIVSESEPSGCNKCKSKNLEQDSDVLDTWFSSCLWPFASMGWPDKTPELDYFFPTSTLVTGHDIIFFWVARMIMMSLYFTGDIPFSQVFINPLVTDPSGQKMSKSKGNVVDPMGIINKNGADVLRFTLTSLTTPGRNLLLGKEKIEGVRNFANKLWNASKFVISSIADADNIKNIKLSSLNLNIWDRWILTRFLKVLRAVEKYLQKYDFSYASRLLQRFFWNDYCDWYIESVKVRIYSSEDADDRKTAQYILWDILEKYLRMLHPFMPFMTEQIWQNIPHEGESIMIQKFPEFSSKLLDRNVEKDIATLFDVISEIRKIRSELNINPSVKIKVNLVSGNSRDEEILRQNKKYIYSLAKVGNLEFCHSEEEKGYVKTTKGNTSIYIYILDIVDVDLEIKRILDEAEKIKKDIEKSGKKISNPQFLEKAPSEIIKKEKDKFYKFNKILKVLNEQLKRMNNIKK
jgi:valyl-tRNA synthetase